MLSQNFSAGNGFIHKTELMELNNKIAVVTGVSKGVGLEVVKLLVEKGTIVAGWGRNKPAFDHPKFHFFTCDVAVEEQVENAFQARKVGRWRGTQIH